MLDIVIGGPDMSGTSTQLKDTINFFQSRGLKVRDLRGTEIDALFHAEKFKDINGAHLNMRDFFSDEKVPEEKKQYFLKMAVDLLSSEVTNGDLKVASCIQNEVSTYVDPDSSDVWVMEEPSKRGAGQVNRVIEQQRTKYGSISDQMAAAYCHSAYRVDEFLRFRKTLREKNKIIIRSRSEESACYQVYEEQVIPLGISQENYLNLPGHAIAFSNPPTHLFIACAPVDWTIEQYLQLKEERSGGRLLDDYESMAHYQVLVNQRYATNWIEQLYRQGCTAGNAKTPAIHRFNLYDTREEIRQQMEEVLEEIIKTQCQD